MLFAVQRALLAAAVVATGLAAGFFYAYEVSVTRGTELLGDEAYVDAMNAINATVRNGAFFVVFFGALVLGGAAVLSRLGRFRSVATWLVAAGVGLYAVAFAVTALLNVPLNEELAASTASDALARAAYEDDWNRYNLIRTVSSLVGFVSLLAGAMVERSRSRDGVR